MSVYLKCNPTVTDVYPPRIVCFVCGVEGPADYPLFISPQGTTVDRKLFPHFPFLRELEPPLGARPPTHESSTASSCRACYSSLMKQWTDNEKGGVPLENRVYWTKRTDGLPVLQPDQQLAINRAEMNRYPGVGLTLPKSGPGTTTSSGGSGSAAVIAYGHPHLNIHPAGASHTQTSMMAAPPLLAASSSVRTRTPDGRHQMFGNTGSPLESTAGHWREMGPPSTSATPLTALTLGDSSQDDNDSALDLSSGSRDRDGMKSRSSAVSHVSAASHHSSYLSEGAGSSTDILDLTLPDKNASTEVCYVCGDDFKKGMLLYINTRSTSKQPHYPSLVYHSRPPRSRPMDSAGRVQSCEECSQYLFLQWEKFEFSKVTHADRNYILRKRHSQVVDTATFVCYICALDYHSSSLRLLYCRANSESEPFYPHIEQAKPPPGVSPISSGGMVQVCSHCYKCTREKHQGLTSTSTPPVPPSSVGIEPPPKKRKSSRASVEIVMDPDQPDDEDKISPADIECLLCHRKFTVHSFKFLNSQGPPLGGIPYFPFLKTLPRLNDEPGMAYEDDSQGRVRACQTCTTSLINQWTTYQRDALPIEERMYFYQSLAGPQSSGRVTPGTLLSRATATPTSGRSLHSPGTGSGNPTPAPTPSAGQMAAAAAGTPSSTPSKSQVSETVRPRSNSNTAHFSDSLKINIADNQQRGGGSKSASAGGGGGGNTAVEVTNPNSPRIPAQPPQCHSPISVHSGTSADPSSHKPSTSSFYCFLCGLHSELSFARMLYSHPQGKKAPFFPFMKEHTPKPRAETIREDGTAIVCTFCYHSVIVQWNRYQDTRSPIPPNSRIYNVNDFTCYVCGVKTYRKRIRALRVCDYPFLRLHKAPKGTITMENGEMAAVCLDCFETLKHQFQEAAKYGIPLEKRQYNWMQIPPPPEDSGLHLATPKERLEKQLVGHC